MTFLSRNNKDKDLSKNILLTKTYMLFVLTLPAAFRIILELLSGTYPIGYDTNAIYIQIQIKPYSLLELYSMGPLYFLILKLEYLVVDAPLLVVKINSVILTFILTLTFYWFSMSILEENNIDINNLLYITLAFMFNIITLRLLWDLHRQILSLIFAFATYITFQKKRYALQHIMAALCILANPLGVFFLIFIFFSKYPKLIFMLGKEKLWQEEDKRKILSSLILAFIIFISISIVKVVFFPTSTSFLLAQEKKSKKINPIFSYLILESISIYNFTITMIILALPYAVIACAIIIFDLIRRKKISRDVINLEPQNILFTLKRSGVKLIRKFKKHKFFIYWTVISYILSFVFYMWWWRFLLIFQIPYTYFLFTGLESSKISKTSIAKLGFVLFTILFGTLYCFNVPVATNYLSTTREYDFSLPNQYIYGALSLNDYKILEVHYNIIQNNSEYKSGKIGLIIHRLTLAPAIKSGIRWRDNLVIVAGPWYDITNIIVGLQELFKKGYNKVYVVWFNNQNWERVYQTFTNLDVSVNISVTMTYGRFSTYMFTLSPK